MRSEAATDPTRKSAEALAKKMSGDIGANINAPGAPVVTGSDVSAPAGEKH